MLDMGFTEAIQQIVAGLPRTRQTLLFSATIPTAVRDISRHLQRNPLDITVDAPAETLIEQHFVEVDPAHKLAALKSLLLQYRPARAVVFCNMRQTVREVADALAAHHFAVLALHGELEQRDREEMLVRFANHSCTLLVASDVAARGLDITDLPMVINYDLANDADTHLHRIGRTGRAGQRGIALCLCTPHDLPRIKIIEERLDVPLQWDTLVAGARDAPVPPPFITLAIDAGRQDKLRPGDLLGALTGDAQLPASAVGKIDVFATRTYVAIARDWREQSIQRLRAGKIKGRTFRIREIGG